jgi:hypothetical protein
MKPDELAKYVRAGGKFVIKGESGLVSSCRPLCPRCNCPLSGEIWRQPPRNTRLGFWGKIFPKMTPGQQFTTCPLCATIWHFDWRKAPSPVGT